MQFYGISHFGDKNSFYDTQIHLSNGNRLELTECILDEIKIDLSVDIGYSPTKKEWTYTTHLHAKFQDNIEGGNISVQGLYIEYIRLDRRIKGDSKWQTLIYYKYDPSITEYSFSDSTVANAMIYEYSVLPIAYGGIEGRRNSQEIEVNFEAYFIMNAERYFMMYMNAGYGSLQQNAIAGVHVPMGNKYPIVVHSGKSNYKSGSFGGLFFVGECEMPTLEITNSVIRQTKIYRETFLQWLFDGTSKLLKDTAGNAFIIDILDTARIDLKRESIDTTSEISFDFVETGNGESLEDLRLCNILISNGVIL